MLRALLLGAFRRLAVVITTLNLAVPLLLLLLPEKQEPAAARRATSPQAEAAYAAIRDPLVDRALPAGVGGITIAPTTHGHDGLAYLRQARIVIDPEAAASPAPGGGASRGEVVEMHERAHLLNGALPERVAALLAAVPSPDTASYAATNDSEHFAEMVANAWEIVRLQDLTGLCPVFDIAVAHAEAEVPGTAGLILWFLPTWEAARDTVAAPELRAAAEAHAAPYADEWRAIARAVEERRTANGLLTEWPVPGAATQLRHAHIAMRHDDAWWRRAVGWALWPSAAVARIL